MKDKPCSRGKLDLHRAIQEFLKVFDKTPMMICDSITDAHVPFNSGTKQI